MISECLWSTGEPYTTNNFSGFRSSAQNRFFNCNDLPLLSMDQLNFSASHTFKTVNLQQNQWCKAYTGFWTLKIKCVFKIQIRQSRTPQFRPARWSRTSYPMAVSLSNERTSVSWIGELYYLLSSVKGKNNNWTNFGKLVPTTLNKNFFKKKIIARFC